MIKVQSSNSSWRRILQVVNYCVFVMYRQTNQWYSVMYHTRINGIPPDRRKLYLPDGGPLITDNGTMVYHQDFQVDEVSASLIFDSDSFVRWLWTIRTLHEWIFDIFTEWIIVSHHIVREMSISTMKLRMKRSQFYLLGRKYHSVSKLQIPLVDKKLHTYLFGDKKAEITEAKARDLISKQFDWLKPSTWRSS